MMFNDNLNKYRKQKGLSQEELAFRLGVSRQSVSKWESGQSTPELERIIEIADLFGISLDELIGHESNDYVTVDREELRSVVRHLFTYEYKSKFNWRYGNCHQTRNWGYGSWLCCNWKFCKWCPYIS